MRINRFQMDAGGAENINFALRPPLKSEHLRDQVRERILYKHYSIRTKEDYVY